MGKKRDIVVVSAAVLSTFYVLIELWIQGEQAKPTQRTWKKHLFYSPTKKKIPMKNIQYALN